MPKNPLFFFFSKNRLSITCALKCIVVWWLYFIYRKNQKINVLSLFFFSLQACAPSRYPSTGLWLCAQATGRNQLCQDISLCLLDIVCALCYWTRVYPMSPWGPSRDQGWSLGLSQRKWRKSHSLHQPRISSRLSEDTGSRSPQYFIWFHLSAEQLRHAGRWNDLPEALHARSRGWEPGFRTQPALFPSSPGRLRRKPARVASGSDAACPSWALPTPLIAARAHAKTWVVQTSRKKIK